MTHLMYKFQSENKKILKSFSFKIMLVKDSKQS